jgi:hypothetical protein
VSIYSKNKFFSVKQLNYLNLAGSEDEVTPTRLTNGHRRSNGHDSVQVSSHYGHCLQRAAVDSSAASSPAATKKDEEQLAALYGVRMREIGRLQEVLATSRQEAASQADQLAARILQLEAERAAATSGHHQTQTLLGQQT